MPKKPTLSKEERAWRARDAMQTLARASEIQADKALMADVKRQAQEQIKTLSKVTGAPRQTKRAGR